MLPIVSLPSVQSQAYTTITTQTTSPLTSYETSVATGNSITTTVTIKSPTDMMANESKFVKVITIGFWNALPNASPSPNSVDMRHISMPVSASLPQFCYVIAVGFRAVAGQTVSGSIGPANVDIGLFVTDNRTFYSLALPYLVNPQSILGCTSEVLFHNFTPLVNLPPSHPYWNIPPSYTAPLRNYTATIPYDGEWWITGWVNPPLVVNLIMWEWASTLSPQTHVTTMTSFTTVTNPTSLYTTMGILETEALSQTLAQRLTFTILADQLYSGLAVLFAALFVITLALLIRKRKRR